MYKNPFPPSKKQMLEKIGTAPQALNKPSFVYCAPCTARVPFHDYMATSCVSSDTVPSGSSGARCLSPYLSYP